MKWTTVKIKNYNGFKIDGKTAYAKAQKLYTHRFPNEKTLKRLKELGVQEIVYKNGDFITL